MMLQKITNFKTIRFKWEQHSLPVVVFIVPMNKVLNYTLKEILNTTSSGNTNKC
jgi:hypothetical protein